MQPPKELSKRLTVDQHFALALYEPCDRRGCLSPSNTLCPAQLIDHTRLRLDVAGLARLLVALHCFHDFLGHQLRVDAVQPSQNVQHLVEALGLDRLVGHDAVLLDGLPRNLWCFSVRYCGQSSDFAEKGGKREEIVGEGRLRAEVGWRCRHNAQCPQDVLAALSSIFSLGFSLEVEWLCGCEGLLDLGGLDIDLSGPRYGRRDAS